MKKKSKVFCYYQFLPLLSDHFVVGSIKWNEKIELSSAEATQVLENEGIIEIRTVDTSKFKRIREKELLRRTKSTN
ncbi:hypothetical protein KHA80_11975 [Anaerobacillus sp. HL2]|nr:hypothetical protein KHA80_11975 [Anaerobacillus sp. HL2]